MAWRFSGRSVRVMTYGAQNTRRVIYAIAPMYGAALGRILVIGLAGCRRRWEMERTAWTKGL